MNVRRTVSILVAATALAACADAQPAPWSLSLRASGTWSAPRTVEIDSAGSLVVREGAAIPRCASLDNIDVGYLDERVAEVRRSTSSSEQSWAATAADGTMATLTITWTDTGSVVTLRLPLGRLFRSGDAPAFVVELVDKVWALREQAEDACA
jgi:hypothetical protein